VLPKWSRKKLSKEASQTLVLIAYMEPVTVAQLSERRGTDCSAALQTLRNRGLIARKAQLGQRRQKVYQTTAHFLEVCGLQSLEEFFQEGTRQSLFPDLFSASAEEEEVEEAEELEEDEDDSESED
jgi:segregation and condensation protein B